MATNYQWITAVRYFAARNRTLHHQHHFLLLT